VHSALFDDRNTWRMAVGEVWRMIRLTDREEIGTVAIYGGKRGWRENGGRENGVTLYIGDEVVMQRNGIATQRFSADEDHTARDAS